jgi:two-component system nitrate/nitrite response regulator NarL
MAASRRDREAILRQASNAIAGARALEPVTRRALARARSVRESTNVRRAAFADVVDVPTRVEASNLPSDLTPRQREILALLAQGLGTRQIAARLWLSPATVRNHVGSLMSALGVHSRLQALAEARRRGLID